MTKKIVSPIVRVRVEGSRRVLPIGGGRIMTAEDLALTPRQWLRILRAARKLGIPMPRYRVKA